MFGPALWLVALVVQDAGGAGRIPADPPALRRRSRRRSQGYDKPLPLYRSTLDDGSDDACWPRCAASALVAQMVDPAEPGEIVKVNIDRARRRCARSASPPENYTEPFAQFDFLRYLWNSVFVTVMATIITLLVNSMAAFALSKYEFRGRDRRAAADPRDADGAALGHPGAALSRRDRRSACSTRSGASSCRRWRRRPASSCCASTC